MPGNNQMALKETYQQLKYNLIITELISWLSCNRELRATFVESSCAGLTILLVIISDIKKRQTK